MLLTKNNRKMIKKRHKTVERSGSQSNLSQSIRDRLTTLRDSNEAEKRLIPRESQAYKRPEAEDGGEPQLQNKRGRLTTLRVSKEAENGEPRLHKKRG